MAKKVMIIVKKQAGGSTKKTTKQEKSFAKDSTNYARATFNTYGSVKPKGGEEDTIANITKRRANDSNFRSKVQNPIGKDPNKVFNTFWGNDQKAKPMVKKNGGTVKSKKK